MATISIEMEDKDMEELTNLKIEAGKLQTNAVTVMRIAEIESSILNKVRANYYYTRGEE